MELCLYDPELGYYSRNAQQFGKAGDFYTSSDVHAVFGRLLARQFDEMWRALGSPEKIRLVELGPGRGLFAHDVLSWSQKKFPDFFSALHYELVENSQPLRGQIQESLGRYIESGKAELITLAVLERKTGFDGIVFANEFFDALPVEILSAKGSLRVDTRDGRFVETWAKASPGEMEFLDRYSVHPENDERVEAPLAAQQTLDRIAASVQRGFLVAIDYGYTRDELLAGRHRGTLKAIRQHSVSADPYEAPGEQDITADVNFTALAAAAEKQGMQTHRLVTQSQFLMGIEKPIDLPMPSRSHLPQERAKVRFSSSTWSPRRAWAKAFMFLLLRREWQEKMESLSGLNFGRRPMAR